MEQTFPDFDKFSEKNIKDANPFVFITVSEVEHIIEKYELTPYQARILTLIALEGWSRRDVARHLGVSRQAVQNALRRVRKRVFGF